MPDMPGLARLGDQISCGDTIASGSGNVFINGLPAALLDGMTTGHDGYHPTVLIGPCTSTVFINGLPAAVIGKTRIKPHNKRKKPLHDGVVSSASGTVSAEG